MKLLSITENNVESKLIKILPHTTRVKTGHLITENLNATDDKKYDKLIKHLLNNQKL